MLQRFLSLAMICLLVACTPPISEALQQPIRAEITLRWELLTNNINSENQYQVRFTLLNQSRDTLPATGWAIYFNQLSGTPLLDSLSQMAHIQRIAGDFYRLQPGPNFQAVAPNDSVQLELRFQGWLIKDCEAPQMPYIVFNDADGAEQLPKLLSSYTIMPISPSMAIRGRNDQTPIPTPEWRYTENEHITPLPYAEITPIIPTPLFIQKDNNQAIIDEQWRIAYTAGVSQEAICLSKIFENLIKKKILTEEKESSKNKQIILRLDPNLTQAESYRLQVSPDYITIEGADAAGVFYSIQSLLALLPPYVLKKI